MESASLSRYFTLKIVIGMVAGIVLGVIIQSWLSDTWWQTGFVDHFLAVLGQVFLRLIKMLVVPLVFISLVCGSASMGDFKTMGRIGLKSLMFYLITTAIAIALALSLATLLGVGHTTLPLATEHVNFPSPPGLKAVILNIIPINPFAALAEGNMLQIIVLALLVGVASLMIGQPGQSIIKGFVALNTLMMRLVTMILELAPYGVFCLLATQFSQLPVSAIMHLVGYFFTVLLALLVQWVVVYSLILLIGQGLNPWHFFRKLYNALIFAFSTSSSVASIPVVLKTVRDRLGVNNKVASFVIPLGATINMDGTAIMQGVATVFIAHLYHIPLTFTMYITVIAMATLASVGTAGVPGVGLMTLMMVLQQIGLPIEGIAMIIGIDRLLDMARTAVNISGDAMIACMVASSEKLLDKVVYCEHEELQPIERRVS